jgi:hypothetical protein
MTTFFKRGGPGSGRKPYTYPRERWLLGKGGESGKNCSSCKEFARMGWKPLGFFPEQRSNTTYCQESCDCRMEYNHAEYAEGLKRITDWKKWQRWFGMVYRSNNMAYELKGNCVHKSGEKEPLKCHASKAEAEAHMKALYANVKNASAPIQFFPTVIKEGGAGSGNFGHAGRPGEVGGSGPGGSPDKFKISDKELISITKKSIQNLGKKINTWSARDQIMNLSNEYLHTDYASLSGEKGLAIAKSLVDQLNKLDTKILLEIGDKFPGVIEWPEVKAPADYGGAYEDITGKIYFPEDNEPLPKTRIS